MANEKHLEILKSGVDKWNEWRANNPNIIANIKEAELSFANLSRANLNYAELSRANLYRVKLKGAHLADADLRGAKLNKADLTRADLRGAKLYKADLEKANLREANFGEVDLRGANLERAKLQGAKLRMANLTGAKLTKALLDGVDLRDANLREADLLFSDLSNAQFHGIRIWGATCDGWNVAGVKCTHIYDDIDGKNRVPKDRDFEEGEFERLYASLPTFEYIFKKGMNPLDPFFMNQVVEEIRKQNPEFEVEIDSISAKGAKPSIKFSVKDEKYKEAAEAKVRAGYEQKIARLEGHEDKLMRMLENALENPRSITMGDSIQITGDVTSSSVGKNEGTQTWNITAPIEDSHKLDDEAKKWLLSIAEKIQAEAIPDDEKPVVESKMNQLQTELEKDDPDKPIIQRAWSFLKTVAPTFKTLVEVPDKIFSLLIS